MLCWNIFNTPYLKKSSGFHKFHKFLKLFRSIDCITLYKFAVKVFPYSFCIRIYSSTKWLTQADLHIFNIALKWVPRFSNPTSKCNISFIPTSNQVFQHLKFMTKTCSIIPFKQILSFKFTLYRNCKTAPSAPLHFPDFVSNFKICLNEIVEHIFIMNLGYWKTWFGVGMKEILHLEVGLENLGMHFSTVLKMYKSAWVSHFVLNIS